MGQKGKRLTFRTGRMKRRKKDTYVMPWYILPLILLILLVIIMGVGALVII